MFKLIALFAFLAGVFAVPSPDPRADPLTLYSSGLPVYNAYSPISYSNFGYNNVPYAYNYNYYGAPLAYRNGIY